MHVRIFGALHIDGSDGPVDLGGRRQQAVLARLLIADGAFVSQDRLIDDIWCGSPPASAVGTLQAYLSNLRRSLEPDRSPGVAATKIVRSAHGYAVDVSTLTIDARQFESTVAETASTSDPMEQCTLLRSALGLWTGDPFGSLGDEHWARVEVCRLVDLKHVAQERLAEQLIDSGDTTEAVAWARRVVDSSPLREDGWRLYATALHSEGRQSDALEALRTARSTYQSELGLELPARLQTVEQEVLNDVRPLRASPVRQSPVSVRGALGTVSSILDQARWSSQNHAMRIVSIQGELGIGKTTVLEQMCAFLKSDGWVGAFGRCPRDKAGIPAKACADVVRQLLSATGPSPFARDLAPLVTPSPTKPTTDAVTGRFLVRRAFVDFVEFVAATAPLVMVFDDLQHADEETVGLLAALVEHACTSRLLLAFSFREHERTPVLDEFLGAIAVHRPVALTMRGLSQLDSQALIARVAGTEVDRDTSSEIARRTAGNPFYLTECAKTLSLHGTEAALVGIPRTVEDVVRGRMATLSRDQINMLELASVAGDAPTEILLDTFGDDKDAAVNALEYCINAGLLVETSTDAITFRHSISRDAVLHGISRQRRHRIHERVGLTIEKLRPGDTAGLAHHFNRTGSNTTVRKAIRYDIAAGDDAARRFAHTRALEHYERAHDASLAAGDVPVQELVSLQIRLRQEYMAIGSSARYVEARRRSIEWAEVDGRPELIVAALSAGFLPPIWTKRTHDDHDQATIKVLERLLTDDQLAGTVRIQLLCVLVDEIGEATERAVAAATEAESLARALGDPVLLGAALTARTTTVMPELARDRSRTLSAELHDHANRYVLPLFTFAAERASFIDDCVSLHTGTLRGRIQAMAEFGDRYSCRHTQSAVAVAVGMLAHLTGDTSRAASSYAQANDVMTKYENVLADESRIMANATLALTERRLPDMEQVLARHERPDCLDEFRALARAQMGDRDRASSILRSAPRIRQDYLWSLLATVRGATVAAVGTPDEIRRQYTELLPLSGQIAGTHSARYVAGPVDTTLGDLAAALGDTDAAVRHHEIAVSTARRWGSEQWVHVAAQKLASV